MSRRPDPLVPLELFRNRRFAVINLSTFLIYGALYVFLGYNAIFVQGTLGYSALAASVVGLPVGILLSLLSTRVGSLAGRIGPRRFLVTGPLLMAGGMLWYARIPATSEAWAADLGAPASLLPPGSAIVDVVVPVVLFGVGISLVVAPLTSTLMSSIPVARAGLGSAINNAISRVGQPLIGAIVFIAITASFYNGLADRVPGLDPTDPAIRATIAPLNGPPADASVELGLATREASTDAFRLALLVSAVLLASGAAVNGIGLRARA
jgi:predicted MFS family arabinose efflux permease